MKKEVYEEGLDGYDWYEGQPKWPLRRIIKTVIYVLSAVVWILILGRIFLSGNSEYEDHLILLNEQAAAVYPAEKGEVLRLNSTVNETADLSVFIYNTLYLDEAKNLQFTARINRRNLPPVGEGLGYHFILRETVDGESRYFPLSYSSTDSTSSYDFYRLCFEGVEWQQKGTYTFMVFRGDFDPAQTQPPYAGNRAVFLFTLSDSDTFVEWITPDPDDFKTLAEIKK